MTVELQIVVNFITKKTIGKAGTGIMSSPTPESEPGVCPDWIWPPESDVHVAGDINWFVKYEPFETFICGADGHKERAAGVGILEIPVNLGGGRSGKVRLRDVLHVPGALCNIIAHHTLTSNYDEIYAGKFYTAILNLRPPSIPSWRYFILSPAKRPAFWPIPEQQRWVADQYSSSPFLNSLGAALSGGEKDACQCEEKVVITKDTPEVVELATELAGEMMRKYVAEKAASTREPSTEPRSSNTHSSKRQRFNSDAAPDYYTTA
ncbi:hypothetical protein B0H63DRAFT_530255 [Podospora didyma]|uniref:Retrovirus-related Pol polyprotein from transposon TNT 1-94-like beta-barrel domain-containing protein n=1 Tax=Podospora didyma TaxID=330526 RepID=A0AAE0P3U3_9PEZI|nr:hypothetical protein B0H63DRAFT_530255 [Podospora didyma]